VLLGRYARREHDVMAGEEWSVESGPGSALPKAGEGVSRLTIVRLVPLDFTIHK